MKKRRIFPPPATPEVGAAVIYPGSPVPRVLMRGILFEISLFYCEKFLFLKAADESTSVTSARFSYSFYFFEY